jgi:hypothetical protein
VALIPNGVNGATVNSFQYHVICLSTLTKILESVQQFASIGDVMTGGFQNRLACSVWSFVRVGVLVSDPDSLEACGSDLNDVKTASRLASYLETLSAVFMEIGRRASRFHEIVLSVQNLSRSDHFFWNIQPCRVLVPQGHNHT